MCICICVYLCVFACICIMCIVNLRKVVWAFMNGSGTSLQMCRQISDKTVRTTVVRRVSRAPLSLKIQIEIQIHK